MTQITIFEKPLRKVALSSFLYLSFVSAVVAELYSNVIKAMAASKTAEARLVLIIAHTDVERLYPEVNELPIAIKFLQLTRPAFLCEFHVKYVRNCGVPVEQQNDFENARRILYLPFVSSIPHSYKRSITDVSRVFLHWLVIRSEAPRQTFRDFSRVLCNVVSISAGEIQAPVDRFRSCGQHHNVTASSLFTTNAASPRKYPKGQKYRAAVRVHGGSKANFGDKTEAIALMDAYRALNNTVEIIEVVNLREFYQKSIDIIFIPLSNAYLESMSIFRDAYYSPLQLCFFSGFRKFTRLTTIDTWEAFVQFILALSGAASFFGLYIYLRNRILFRGRQLLTLPDLLVFFISTVCGRSPAVSKAQAPAHRSLAVASWTLGMVFLGNYIQTSITAMRVIPKVLPSVRTLEELQTCSMSVCMDRIWRDIYAQMQHTNIGPSFLILESIAWQCDNVHLISGDLSSCYEKAHEGTHVALSTCSEGDISVASRWGLFASDSLSPLPQVAPIHVLHPARFQHRRLLLAIAEHGLAVPHRRRAVERMTDADRGEESFVLYYSAYLVGCTISCAALVAERLKYKRKQRQNVCSHSQPDVLSTT